MATVNSIIKRILKEKDAGIRTGVTAMRDVLQEVQKQVTAELGQAALGSWDSYHLKQVMNSLERRFAEFDLAAKKELGSQLDLAWNAGDALVVEPLTVSGLSTGFNISTSSLEALKDFSFNLMEGVSKDAWIKIRGELNLGILGKSPAEVAKAVGRNLKDKGIFRSVALRGEAITKTEMGRVFSKASQERMEKAAERVPGLEKEWRHRGHPKVPRPTHLSAHGQHVKVDKPFLIGGTAMMYPRDPLAGIGEVIHCGCDHVPYHENWQKAA